MGHDSKRQAIPGDPTQSASDPIMRLVDNYHWLMTKHALVKKKDRG
jgi:hypothetical protein